MKVNNFTVGDKSLQFTLHSATNQDAADLRKFLVNDLPSFAPYKVIFYENTTVLGDDFLAPRIGLIPFVGNSVSEEEVVFSFNKIAQGDEVWTTESLHSEKKEIELQPLENAVLVKVIKGQRLRFKCYVRKGYGREHSRWSIVSSCCFTRKGNDFDFVVDFTHKLNVNNVVRILQDKY